MLRRFKHLLGCLGFLLAGLSMVSQLALGAVVLPDASPQSEIATLAAVSILCVGAHAPHDKIPDHRHRKASPAVCPLSAALALPRVVPTAAPEFPVRSSAVPVFWTQRPPSCGPPPASARVGIPRGPPLTA